MEMKIDIHCHFFPKKYLDKLKEIGAARFGIDKDGRRYMQGEGYVVWLPESFMNTRYIIEDMDRFDIQVDVLSTSNPRDKLSPKEDVTLSKIFNDELAKEVDKHPNRFVGLASLPFTSPEEAVDELERAVKDLGLKGAMSLTNVRGKPLDSEEFFPLYRKLVDLDAPLYIHPKVGVVNEGMTRQYGLTLGLELPFATCMCFWRLVYGGVLEKFPGLNLIAAHLGGALPFLVERFNRARNVFPECKQNITTAPAEYLKEVYLDTVSFHKPAIECAYSFWGSDKLMLGSDYPTKWGDQSEAANSIRDLDIPEEDKEKIFSLNAQNLFKI